MEDWVLWKLPSPKHTGTSNILQLLKSTFYSNVFPYHIKMSLND